MSLITLIPQITDHSNLQITAFHTCLHNGMHKRSNRSLYQILEVLWSGKNCHSLVSSRKSGTFCLKHIFLLQSSCIIRTVIRAYELTYWISPKYSGCLINTAKRGRHVSEMSSSSLVVICAARTLQSEALPLLFATEFWYHNIGQKVLLSLL